jgi:AcrR family transcriptional regulator
MSPRPRTKTDEQILIATIKTMSRLGPVKLTLAEVAREAGLSAATLVQRFGSKRALLLAVSESAATGMDGCFDTIRDRHTSPLEALIEAATDMARYTRTPDEMANSLAFLHIDVSDPDFRRPMIEMSRKTLRGYERLIDAAVEAGELRRCDSAALARAISALTGGSLILWGVFRKGTAEAWVRADLDALIDPYRWSTAGKPEPRKRTRRRLS